MAMPNAMELVVILGVVVLLFGSKKIPELAKGIGQGIKNFKKEMQDDTTAETVYPDTPKKVEFREETASVTHTKTAT
ncbi:MAG: twin-arginine translocase TatA/TatE family subunit [Campylobacterales bacterium]|nr:twin-arginine translocase TatA/TatE family subunit [Campylobacterales bacterium]